MNPTKYDLAALEPHGAEAFRQIAQNEVRLRHQAQWEASYWREMAEAGADDLAKSARALRTEHRRFVIATLVCCFAVPLAVGRLVDVVIRWWAL
jgi:hypothetical protein